MAEIAIEQVTKVYPQGTKAVDGVDLEIPDGSLTVLVGPSGCGKTTLLRMIAGLEEISSGMIKIEGRVVNQVSPKDRDIAMVFQNYALYPHMNVTQNLAFGLRQRKLKKSEIGHRVQDVAHRLALGEMLGRKPGQLSGGQQQRVAMGRAIVRNPKAFLMDEPLSNLDAKLRVQMRTEISRLQRELGATMIYVTHDQIEAMTMGDQVAVMRAGVLQQVDKPYELYTHPANLFVAGFIGSPAMNMIEAIIEQRDGSLYARFGSCDLCVDGYPARRELLRYVGGRVALGIRPEVVADARLSREMPENQTLRVKVELLEALGSEVLVHFGVEAPPVLTDQTIALARDTGEDGGTELEREAAAGTARLVARLDARSRAAEGEPVDLVVDTERLQFFDLTTGRTLADRTDHVCRPT